MQKVNDLFGKQVINQSTGSRVAAVRDVVLSSDNRRIVALIVGDGGWSNNDERVVRWNTVISAGDYVIVEGTTPFGAVAEDLEVADLRKQAEQITGKPVVSIMGERLGTVGDMFFDMTGRIIGYEIRQGLLGSDNPLLRAEHVQAVGKDAVIATTNELIPASDVGLLAEEVQDPAVGAPRVPIVGMPANAPGTAVQSQSEPIGGAPGELHDPTVGEHRNFG